MTDTPKYIFVTGGVTSSLGKGILAASLAKLLQLRGYRVSIQKFDPYINIDPGTLNPYEHGECYVTYDGAETDLDLGHYERFLNTETSQANNVTTGRIYQTVIHRERLGDYKGKTVQVVPHITDEIKRRFRLLNKDGDFDIILTEIGGTVGDIESFPYIEALRQFRFDHGPENVIVVHLTLVPYLAAVGELKTKPTQHSVKTLLQSGIQPDVLVCRSEVRIPPEVRAKVARFCNVRLEAVIENLNAPSIYEVPFLLKKENLDKVVLKLLDLDPLKEPDLSYWKDFVSRLKNPLDEVNIGLVGKYVELHDSYLSISESLRIASAKEELKVNISWIHSEDITPENHERVLKGLHGIIVAPGFGERGIEGKIYAVKYAREYNIPFVGICLGMQIAMVEYARHVMGYSEAHSVEFDPETPYPVIGLMEEQKKVKQLGGTMRLGAYECTLAENSVVRDAYGEEVIYERHRHRYELNNKYVPEFENSGMRMTGINPRTGLVEIVEIPSHPFFVGTQFHPEYKSTVETPHPLFQALIRAAHDHKNKEDDEGEELDD
ncbi:MAG: CTP synthase [Bacteroidia bacterium]|nr:CTP synthase [Bacteroidia bacterium]